MSKIICIGSSCKDTFFPTSEGIITETPEDLLSQKKISFELGAKYKIEERYEALGGCAANVASGLAQLGMESYCYSMIGSDFTSQWIEDELKRNKVNTELVSREDSFLGDASSIVVDEKSGDRVIFSNQRVNGELSVDGEKLKGCPWIFIGDLHGKWEDNLDVILEAANNEKIKVAYNPRQSDIHDDSNKIVQAISFCEIIFVNKDEAMEIVSAELNKELSEKLKDEKFLIDELRELGPKIIVLTDGENGAWAANSEKIFYAPAQKVEAKDATGAGDAFSSGFLSAYIKEKSLEECLQWGIANSSNVVKFYGAIEGLLGEGEIIKAVDKIKTEEII